LSQRENPHPPSVVATCGFARGPPQPDLTFEEPYTVGSTLGVAFAEGKRTRRLASVIRSRRSLRSWRPGRGANKRATALPASTPLAKIASAAATSLIGDGAVRRPIALVSWSLVGSRSNARSIVRLLDDYDDYRRSNRPRANPVATAAATAAKG